VLPSFWFVYCAPIAGDVWNLKHRRCDDVRPDQGCRSAQEAVVETVFFR